jgi:TRAP transporter TAXI family solute receptor
MANSIFAPHSSILETANAIPVIMLPVKQSVIESVCARMGSEPYVIKASTYKWLNQDIPTLAMGAMILIQKSIPEDDVYAIAKALVENVDAIQGVHKSMRALTPELMAGQNTIPYHPGAEKYYKEKGLIK